MELAGEIEEVGSAVTEFGQEVFGVKGFGANAEFVCVRERGTLAHKPASMTFEEPPPFATERASRWLASRRRRFERGRES